MNPQILRKCVEELKKETPNISYVLGMLETVIEMMPNVTIGPSVSYENPIKKYVQEVPKKETTTNGESTEGSGILDAYLSNPGGVGRIE